MPVELILSEPVSDPEPEPDPDADHESYDALESPLMVGLTVPLLL